MKTIEIAPSPLWSYIDEMQIEPTYSGTEVAEILGRSRAWVHKHATAQSIGELRNGQRRYTRHDLKSLKD